MNLFSIIVPECDVHPVLQRILTIGNGFNMDVVNDWARGFIDRDGKFVKEFQISFSSSLWELYIFAVLKSLGQQVDFTHTTPDFVINSTPQYTIEAVTANSKLGEPGPEESFRVKPTSNFNEFNQKACLRLSNAISGKINKYRTSYSALSHVEGKPFVIAIAPYDSPYFFLSCQRAIEMLLFGYIVDEEAFCKSEGMLAIPTYQRDKLVKENGAEVPLGIFNDHSHQEISAVIFSTCGTWGKVRALSSDPNPKITFNAGRLNTSGIKPHAVKLSKAQYTESLLDGLRVYHNPNAVVPLDRSIFRHRDIFQAFYSTEIGDWVHEQRDGLLMFRIVKTEP